jgi:hypothetical protein
VLVSVVASLVRERVNPVKAPAVAAVSQVKDVVYSLWFKLKLAVGSVKFDQETEVAGIVVVQDNTPEASVLKNPLATIDVGRV